MLRATSTAAARRPAERLPEPWASREPQMKFQEPRAYPEPFWGLHPAPGAPRSHGGTAGRLRHIHQFYIEDQIGLCGNRWMIGAAYGNLPITETQLPGNIDAALSTDLHARYSHVPAGKRAAATHHHRHWLRVAHFGFAVCIKNRLLIVVKDGGRVFIGGVELAAIRRYP